MIGLGKERFTFIRGQRGFSLIEILVGLAILTAIGVAFLNGLFTTSKAIMVSQESTITESLARSQMEYIKTQDYILVADYHPSDPDPAYSYRLVDVLPNLAGAGYSVEIDTPVVIPTEADAEFELQIITVVVKRGGEKAFTLSAYRVEN
ncbi:hypothetical protein ES705_10134 [subsurface metagenome]